MAPARKAPSSAAVETKERLTAVVLADSFTQHFRPVTLERPKVLLPLANTPLLDYTLEWLAANAIEEVYVVCCAHAEQVEAHLERAGWLRVRRFAVHPVVSKSCLSMGDALRLLDHKDIIKTDFVLISGDVVTNLKLSAALEAHRRRRAVDKAAIMTLLMRGNVSLSLRARTGETASMAVIDPGNGRLLKYEEYPLAIAPVPSSAGTEEDGGTRSGGGGGDGGGVSSESRPQSSAFAAPAAAGGDGNSVVVPYPGYQRRRRVVSLETALFSERDDVALRTDLMDVGIYICAPEVLMLFSDNFDYQNVRTDFVTGVLSEEELGNKLYVHEITKEYAAHVHSLRSYDAVSRDVLARWTYPFVPDTNVFRIASGGDGTKGRSQYRYGRSGVYMDAGSSVARSALIAASTCLGADCVVGEGAVVENSIVGNGCLIGADAMVSGCYLGSGVVVGEGAVVKDSMVCDDVVIKPGASIEPNVVLSFRVVIDRHVTVPGGSRIALVRPPSTRADGTIDSDEEGEVPHTPAAGTAPMARSHSHHFNDDASGAGGGNSATRRSKNAFFSHSSNSSDDADDASTGTDDDNDDHDDTDDGFGGRLRSSSGANAVQGPDAKIVSAAMTLAAGGIPEVSIDFATELVGPMGAGFAWPPAPDGAFDASGLSLAAGVRASAGVKRAAALESEFFVAGGDAEDGGMMEGGATGASGGGGGAHAALGSGGGDASDVQAAQGGAVEPHFKREVAETFLRCVKEGISQENVVIELNGLKIAEDKTFADCARYMLTTALGLCLPPAPNVAREYKGLYPQDDLDTSTREGRLELLKRASLELKRWAELLRKFLRSEEDQVEVLLTLEEFCGAEGDFESTGERGEAFAGVFPQLLKVLYEFDIAGEEALLAWAAEKEHAEEDEKVFLRLAEPFLEWLEEAEEETESDAEDEE